MKLRNWLLLSIAFAAVAFAQQQRVNLIAYMGGFGKGKVTFKTRASTSGFEVEVQGEGERLVRNRQYILNIGNGKIKRTVTTNVYGEYHWSMRRIGTNQPIIRAGERAVLTTLSGVPVQAGVFH